MQRISKPFIVGFVVILVGCTVAGAAFVLRQTTPAAVAAPQPSQAPPSPGSEIPADPAVVRAIVQWLPSVGTIPPSALTGGRDTEFLDCHSGKVNLIVTHGWCFASPVNLFYDVSNGTFLDPLTGQLFTYDAAQAKLFTAPRRDRVQQELEPPHLPEKHPANANPPVTGKCTNGQDDQNDNQQQDADDHVKNLRKNADRSDSPIMQTLFREQAQWWQNRCP